MVRKPRHDEARICAELIYLSGPELFNFYFAGGPDVSIQLLEVLLARPDNAFSGDVCLVEENAGEIRGAIVFYPGKDKKRLENNIGKSGKDFIRIAGIAHTMKMIVRGYMTHLVPPVEDDELYIANLAVAPAHRGAKVSSTLLNAAEDVARNMGVSKMVLFADERSSHARAVYKKRGYFVTEHKTFPDKYHKYDITGYCRMHKILEPAT